MATAYFRRPDGAVLTRSVEEVTGPIEASLAAPPGAVAISEEEYRAELAAHQAARDARIAADRTARQEKRQAACEQLVRLGLDSETAVFLTGATPQADG